MKEAIKRVLPNVLWQRMQRVKRDFELRRIKSQTSVTKEQLVRDLRALGLKREDLLFIHSSLRSLGFVEGGPDTVIEALLEVVGDEGTLLFPTFTIHGSMKETLASEEFIFDPVNSPSTVGKITEIFRRRPGVRRSHHPTHSVAAMGPLAEELTRTHLKDGTNFGAGSPFGKMLEHGGKVVGLGINFGPVTYYHVYEDLNLDKFRGVYLPEPLTTMIELPGGRQEIPVRCHAPAFHRYRIDKTPDIESFFSDWFQANEVAHMGQVGKSISWWIFAQDMIESLEKLYAEGVTIYKTPNLTVKE
ncbi:MAG: AAC(3) family N-acetyltransferase [Candidatus Krumholzibacteria bacterium]|nr:AAC(3) family N-acetyltransferase [Candidatus Krumholzibacteria bacterium]